MRGEGESPIQNSVASGYTYGHMLTPRLYGAAGLLEYVAVDAQGELPLARPEPISEGSDGAERPSSEGCGSRMTTETHNASLILLKHRVKWERKGTDTGWAERHAAAWPKSVVRKLTDAAAKYADDYRTRYEGGPLGGDYILGDAWYQIMDGIRTMLTRNICAWST